MISSVMEVQGLYNSAVYFETGVLSMVESLVVETALLGFLLVIRSLPDDNNAFTNLVGKDQRFPMAELNKVKEPVAENKDAGESEDNDEDDESDDEDDDSESGEDSDDDDDDDSDDSDDVETNGDGGSDDEDDTEDDSDDDEDDDDDEEDDDEDDVEEQPQPPSKKKNK